MLVLTRRKGESVLIGDNIEITVLEASNDTIKIGISAPRDINVLRKELYVEVENENKSAIQPALSALDIQNQLNKLKKLR